MTVSQLLTQALKKNPWYQGVLSHLQAPTQAGKPAASFALNNLECPSLKALLIWLLLNDLNRPLVLIHPDPQALLRLVASLESLFGATEAAGILAQQVVRYPVEGVSPYDMAAQPVSVLREHYQFLEALQQSGATQKPQLFLLAARALVPQAPTWADRQGHGITLAVDEDTPPETLMAHATAMGYSHTGLILEPGDISRRGDIVDIYPVQGQPVRVSFFGDTVETIRRIDLETQRSVQTLSSVSLLPRSTLVLTPQNKALLQQKLPKALQAQSKTMQKAGQQTGLEALAFAVNTHLEALESELHPEGLDGYAPLAHPLEGLGQALSEALPANALIIWEDWDVLLQQVEAYADRLAHQYQDGLDKGHYLQVEAPPHQSAEASLASLKNTHRATLSLSSFATLEGDAVTGAGVLPALEQEGVDRFGADLAKAVTAMARWRSEGYQVLVSTDFPQRVLDTCKEADLPAEYLPDELADDQLGLNRRTGLEILVAKSSLPDGFKLPQLKLIHLTDAELFGRHRVRRKASETRSGKKDDLDVIQSLSELRAGDYVVHYKHGIGQFVELSQITLDKEVREYLTLQYKGNDKLYVPVDQVNLLSRYRGAGDTAPPLNKIGGADWNKVKTKVKQSVQSIANELVLLYAAREKVEGYAFEGDSPWQVEMEEAFPYQETPDQWKAICETKSDMESHKPMDRLICGDVGFGKTEVALRALFKAVLSGKQAAVLVPTTILAQQHFNTIADRLKPYPVKVGLLSRFRSPKEQQELVERLKVGECDIVVGTHRILQKDVRFKDLGLLVIDEEHRFGVAHKEKIKQLRTHVDVLTMSATPIPRTLYMSLSGVREMTLINTPPVNRSPVQTFVAPKNPAQIRMAILQEVDRGGQVYYLHNRVQSLYTVAAELEQLVPEVRVAVAHGQMNPSDLETVMLDFSSAQYDVLLCTTIIESGVDIPNANTLIVDDADRYGLAQLYQIRGRVGRSQTQAYAYLYYSPDKQLTDEAKNRLRAIREFTALGSGYQIAMRDMEIRGVGNILGAEQHGHMIQVGFDMYCDLLAQAVEAAQQGEAELKERAEPSVIDLNVTAFIPEGWVGDKDVKLSEYKRLAKVDSEAALTVIEAQWQDRFGKIPAEALQLLALARLRVMATDLAIPLVRTDEEHLRITAPYTLQQWMGIQANLPAKATKGMRWVAGVRTLDSSLPSLQLRLLGMDGAEQVKFLTTLFEGLKQLKKQGKLDGTQDNNAAKSQPAKPQPVGAGVVAPTAAQIATANNKNDRQTNLRAQRPRYL